MQEIVIHQKHIYFFKKMVRGKLGTDLMGSRYGGGIEGSAWEHVLSHMCYTLMCYIDHVLWIVQAFEFELRREYTEHYLCKQVTLCISFDRLLFGFLIPYCRRQLSF